MVLRRSQLSAENTPQVMLPSTASSPPATTSASHFHRRVFLQDILLEKDDKISLADGSDPTALLAPPPGNSCEASSCVAFAASSAAQPMEISNNADSNPDKSVTKVLASSSQVNANLSTENAQAIREGICKGAMNTQDFYMDNDSTHLDWHMEILCSLFLRSDEKEIDWLEDEVKKSQRCHKNLKNKSKAHTDLVTLNGGDRNVGNSNSFQYIARDGFTSTEIKSTQREIHDQSSNAAMTAFESLDELKKNRSWVEPHNMDVGNILKTPQLQPQLHPQQVSQQRHRLITQKSLTSSNQDSGTNVAIVFQPPQQQVYHSIIHNNTDIEHKEKFNKTRKLANSPADLIQQFPEMEMELPNVEHSADPTVFSLIPAILREFLNLAPDQVFTKNDMPTCLDSVVESKAIMDSQEPVVDLTLEDNDGGNPIVTKSNSIHRIRRGSPNKLGSVSANNYSYDNNANDHFERHYFTRSVEKAAEEKKIDSNDQNLLLLLDKPFTIPSTWKRPNYAALSLSQLERNIKNSIKRQGDLTQFFLGREKENKSSEEQEISLVHDEQINRDFANGISNDHHQIQQICTSNTDESNETNLNGQQGTDNHKLVSLLYNECSMTTFANWAMMDFSTNIKEHLPSNEDVGSQNLSTSATKHLDESNFHQGFRQNFQSANWARYKKEQSKALSMDTTRFNLPVTPSPFRLCGMCGNFGHYELECDTLIMSDHDSEFEKNIELVNETTEAGSAYNTQGRKRKLSDIKSTNLDNDSKKKIFTFLANEIRIQKTVQDLLSDLEDEQVTPYVNMEQGEKSNSRNQSTFSILDGVDINRSKGWKDNLHLQKSLDEDLIRSDREQQNTPQPSSPIAIKDASTTHSIPLESPEVDEDGEDEEDSSDPYISKSSCCKTCRSGFKGDQMLLCDGCDELFHFKCLDPPLDSVPEGDWFCSNCESYDSDISSVVELEGCEGFVVEQRKRAVADGMNHFAGVSLGKAKSPWTAALSLLTEDDPIVGDETYLRGHLDRQYNDVSPIIPGEICWAKRFDDHLGREDWWPAMVTKAANKRRFKQTVTFFALNQTALLNSSKILPFFPYYEDIGHKRLVRCNTAGHELFRHAVSLCVTTLGLKSVSQVLKMARNGIQKTIGMSENICALSEKLKSSGWKPPVGWEHASFDEIDGVMILSKQDSSQVSSPVEVSNNNNGGIEKTKVNEIRTRSQDSLRNPIDAINLQINYPFEISCNLNEFTSSEIIGGLVSWRPSSRSASASGGSDEDQYGVVMAINGANESALIRALPALSQVSSGNFDALFREGHDSASSFIHAHDLGATIWMPLSSLRFVSSKACSNDIRHFRMTLKSAMDNEMKSFSLQCRRAAVNREEHMVELGARESLDITDPMEPIRQGPRGGERRVPILRTDSGGEVFHVEAILDERSSASSEKQYLIKWKGFDDRHNTWEPARNIYSQDILLRYKATKLLERLRQSPEASDPTTLTYQIMEAIRVGVERMSAGDAETTVGTRAAVFCPWCEFESMHGRALTNHMKKHRSMRNYDLIRDCIKTCDVSWFNSLRK
ncbi:hypothetical protein ACHAXS_006384 [Conticribra weissflogii]